MEQDVLHQSTDLQRVSSLGLDEFERGVLAIIRQFLLAHETPETQAWYRAFLISVERWGEAVGLAAAHGLSKFVKAVLRFRADGLVFQDPLSTQARDYATDDEALMMAVLLVGLEMNVSLARAEGHRMAHQFTEIPIRKAINDTGLCLQRARKSTARCECAR